MLAVGEDDQIWQSFRPALHRPTKPRLVPPGEPGLRVERGIWRSGVMYDPS